MTLKEELERGVLSRVAEDEPIFVLRAKDQLAEKAIEAWIHYAVVEGVPGKKIAEASLLQTKMIAWADKNGSKIPD